MVNRVILVGRLTADPEIGTTPAGARVATMRVATNAYIGRAEDGTAREITDLHSLVAFGRTAEFVAEHVRGGRLVYAEGRGQTRCWESAERLRRQATEVVVETIRPLGPGPDAQR